ncbi:MAG: FeoC-like transcriptional regulator [Rhodocyclaceae bacterium]|nr:FeoC-like transcriptional regulator [Rhodocyclaceae bacterium]
MILYRLSTYLRTHERATVADLALALESTPEALRAMLATLERKGRVTRLAPPRPACGTTCCKCDAAAVETYAWRTPALTAAPPTPHRGSRPRPD